MSSLRTYNTAFNSVAGVYTTDPLHFVPQPGAPPTQPALAVFSGGTAFNSVAGAYAYKFTAFNSVAGAYTSKPSCAFIVAGAFKKLNTTYIQLSVVVAGGLSVLV